MTGLLLADQTHHGDVLIAAQDIQQRIRNLLHGLDDGVGIIAAGTAAEILDVRAVCGHQRGQIRNHVRHIAVEHGDAVFRAALLHQIREIDGIGNVAV